MNFRIFYILIFSVLLSGCNTGTDFERTNEKDPGAKNFKPNSPAPTNSEITEKKYVNLHWKDNTEFEDGYLVEKKLYEDDEYRTLATLKPNSSFYSDRSKQLYLSTSYRISSFVHNQSGDSTSVSKNSSKIINLNFGTIGSLDLTDKGGQIEIKWGHHLPYFDAITAGYTNSTDGPEDIIWTDTLTTGDFSLDYINKNRKISIDTPRSGFTYNIVLRAGILNPENNLQAFSTSRQEIKVNNPKFEDFTFIDEESLKMEWSTTVDEVDYYEIYESTTFRDEGTLVEKVDGELNSYTLNTSFDAQTGIGLEIKAVKDDDRSRPQRQFVPFQIKNLENFRLITEENSVRLRWNIPEDPYQPYSRIIIERSVNDEENFQVYEELTPDTEEFVDENIRQDEIYYYRIKSASSDYSRNKGTGYLTGFTLQNQIQGSDNIRSLATSPDRQEIGVIDETNSERLLLIEKSGNEREIVEPDHRFFRVQFSSGGKYIILTGDSVRTTYTKIYDRNSLEKKYQFERDYLNEAILLLPDSDRLVTTDYYTTDGNRRTELTVTDINTNEVLESKKEIEGHLLRLMFDSDKNELITISRFYVNSYVGKQLIVFNAENLEQIKKVSPPEIGMGNSYNYDDEYDILYILSDEDLMNYDIETGFITNVFSISRDLNYGICCEYIRRFAHLKKQNLYVFHASTLNNIYVYDPSNDLTTLAIKNEGENIFDLHYSPTDNQLIIQNHQNGTLFYDLVPKWVLIEP